MGDRKTNILRQFMAMLAVVIAALFMPTVAMASPTLVSGTGVNSAAKYQTAIAGVGTVIITNNFGSSDTIELTLEFAPTAANAVYWFYAPGAPSRATQLGSITVKKGTLSGKLTVAAGKLSDYRDSYVTITDGAGTSAGLFEDCEYGPAGSTPAANYNGKITLRNCDNAAALIIVNKEAVVSGMTVTAIVNGKMYKGTAKSTANNFQMSLAKNLEEGTPVWYTVAGPSCRDIGYAMFTLGSVETTTLPTSGNVYVFFQGDNVRTSSVAVTGLNSGDTVRCYNSLNVLLKTVTVSSGNTIANLTGLTLSAGDDLQITVAEKGKYESSPITAAVPTETATAALKSSNVAVTNTIADGATITVKNIRENDTVTVYDAQGNYLDEADAVDDGNGVVTAVISGLDLGATTVYVSVTTAGSSESAWLAVKVTTPR